MLLQRTGNKHSVCACPKVMMDFFCPILEHFCPLSAQIAQMGSLFAQMESLFAQISTPNPCSLLRCHTPLSGICTYIKRPPTPTQNTPFQKPPPAPPRPAPPRARPRRFPPAGVVLSVEKCAPSGPLPPAERTRESGVNAVACMRRHMRRRA